MQGQCVGRIQETFRNRHVQYGCDTLSFEDLVAIHHLECLNVRLFTIITIPDNNHPHPRYNRQEKEKKTQGSMQGQQPYIQH